MTEPRVDQVRSRIKAAAAAQAAVVRAATDAGAAIAAERAAAQPVPAEKEGTGSGG